MSLLTRETWKRLSIFTEHGARGLNAVISKAHPPCVPYVGLILRDIVTLHEYPDFVEKECINFVKVFYDTLIMYIYCVYNLLLNIYRYVR